MRILTDAWLSDMFVNHFPFSTVLRIFDVFMNEGNKVCTYNTRNYAKIHNTIGAVSIHPWIFEDPKGCAA